MSKSVEAYVLINVEHGADEEVLEDIIKLEGVTAASLVYGEFDIHCKVEVDNMDKLKEVVTKIRKFKIITTETLIAYERASKRIRRVTNRRLKELWHARTRR